LWEVLPEIAKLKNIPQDSRYHIGNVFNHTMSVLDNSAHSLEQRLAALFHDVGKAHTFWKVTEPDGTERVSFHGHEKVGAEITSKALSRLKYSNQMRGRVCHMVRMHMRPLSLVNNVITKKAVRKFIRDCYDNKYGVTVEDVLDLNRADILGHRLPDMNDCNALHEAVRKEQEQAPVQELDSPLDGHDIMELYPDMGAGPWVGDAKKLLTDAVVDGILDPNDKEEARDMVLRLGIGALK
jgi:putative nucleotidyltransferase with HDIG domain